MSEEEGGSQNVGLGAAASVILFIAALVVVYLIISGLGDALWDNAVEKVQEIFKLLTVGR